MREAARIHERKRLLEENFVLAELNRLGRRALIQQDFPISHNPKH